MNTDKLVELFREEVEKLEKEAYERGKRDALKMDKLKDKPKTVKRIAKVGERILITNSYENIGYGNDDIGTVIEVVDRTGGGVHVNEWDDYVSYDEYEVIIEEQVQPLSANQQRKGLIEQAREFVESQKNAMGTYEVKDPSSPHAPWHCNVEFIVNEEKRTVVALLRGFFTPTLYAKGIAKCHPDEVFNADIGKAIALARALEFDVPNEFLNAVQPDKVVKGMILQTRYGNRLELTVRNPMPLLSSEKIINDTNAEY